MISVLFYTAIEENTTPSQASPGILPSIGNYATGFTSPHILFPHPLLDNRFELCPEIRHVERIFMNDGRFRMCGGRAIPAEAVYRDMKNRNYYWMWTKKNVRNTHRQSPLVAHVL